MKQKPPAFQFYPKQWMGDDKVTLMDWDAQGMHFFLICISWQQDQPGTLPNDEIMIRRWLRNPRPKIWNRVWPQIRGAWKIFGKNHEFLYSRGMLREFKKIKAFSRLQREKAKLSWLARRKNGDATAHATAMPRHNSGNARAGYALQSSSSPSGEEERKERRTLAQPPPLGGASATRETAGNGGPPPVAKVDQDEEPNFNHHDFVKIGWRKTQEPKEEFEWTRLEGTLSQVERVQSKMREKLYPDRKWN